MSSAVQFIRKQVDLLSESDEAWSRDHREAMQCVESEEWVANLNFVFTRILLLDDRWRSDVFTKKMPYSKDTESQISGLVPHWNRAATAWLARVELFEAKGFSVDGANDLREHIEQAKNMMTPDNEFFKGPGLARLQDDAIESSRAGKAEEFQRMDN